ncbi:PFGI-1 class ICE element type IV pilus protein PilL2 [Aromatoleum toluclasticum]|uniref:PFGI-1 class ICE element type IV pilus protein PilL2 n=1 Tax=Aromatoleum toluclasticum TaxID=92003 RepID=UPI0006863971|nr:PilL N-terminal domain-containing protein [Aromatoleum toluclasticum]
MQKPTSLFSTDPFRLGLCCVAAGLMGTGCAANAGKPIDAAQPSSPVVAPALPATQVSVTRYGRYTLVELVPEPAQRDLLQQTVEVSVPPTLDANVGDAMRHVLLRSGYRLCDAAAALYALPLPAAHLRLGPLVLRDALLTLAGPAWDLSVDDLTRQVCFSRHVHAPASLDHSEEVQQ